MSLFYTYECPDTILEEIEHAIMKCSEGEEIKLHLEAESYKATLSHGKSNCDLSFKIFKVGEDDYFCIEFTRKSGTYISFLNLQKRIENWIQGIEEPPEEILEAE